MQRHIVLNCDKMMAALAGSDIAFDEELWVILSMMHQPSTEQNQAEVTWYCRIGSNTEWSAWCDGERRPGLVRLYGKQLHPQKDEHAVTFMRFDSTSECQEKVTCVGLIETFWGNYQACVGTNAVNSYEVAHEVFLHSLDGFKTGILLVKVIGRAPPSRKGNSASNRSKISCCFAMVSDAGLDCIAESSIIAHSSELPHFLCLNPYEWDTLGLCPSTVASQERAVFRCHAAVNVFVSTRKNP